MDWTLRSHPGFSGVKGPVVACILDGVGIGARDEFDAVWLARTPHLDWLAENALATGDNAGFTVRINNLRALDALTPYTGQVSALDILINSRQANLFLGGRRLADLYRFGVFSVSWVAGSAAVTAPGTFFVRPQ